MRDLNTKSESPDRTAALNIVFTRMNWNLVRTSVIVLMSEKFSKILKTGPKMSLLLNPQGTDTATDNERLEKMKAA